MVRVAEGPAFQFIFSARNIGTLLTVRLWAAAAVAASASDAAAASARARAKALLRGSSPAVSISALRKSGKNGNCRSYTANLCGSDRSSRKRRTLLYIKCVCETAPVSLEQVHKGGRGRRVIKLCCGAQQI